MSGSRRCVVKRDWPGRRLSSYGWMSAAVSGMRGGQPSTTQPSATPWLSPNVVTRNRVAERVVGHCLSPVRARVVARVTIRGSIPSARSRGFAVSACCQACVGHDIPCRTSGKLRKRDRVITERIINAKLNVR